MGYKAVLCNQLSFAISVPGQWTGKMVQTCNSSIEKWEQEELGQHLVVKLVWATWDPASETDTGRKS